MKGKRLWRWAGRILGVLLSAAALTGLCFTLVIAQPQSEAAEEKATQAPWTGAPSRRIDAETGLRELVAAFPGPVMSFMSGSGMTFVSGEAQDAEAGGVRGRVLTLYWQTGAGESLMLQSIYPAEALELMGRGDYLFSATAGPSLFGMSSVRMENDGTIRIHAQVEGAGLYVLTIPASLGGSLSAICRSIQLFTAE